MNNKPKPAPTANSIVIGEPEQEAADIEMAAPTSSSAAEPQTPADEPVSAPAPISALTIDEIIEMRTGDAETTKTQVDTPDVRIRFPEKKRLHWKGKTCTFIRFLHIIYNILIRPFADLAPLTTVGNLVRSSLLKSDTLFSVFLSVAVPPPMRRPRR
jgi:hypothetical protein